MKVLQIVITKTKKGDVTIATMGLDSNGKGIVLNSEVCYTDEYMNIVITNCLEELETP